MLELQRRQAVAMARWEREQQAIAGAGPGPEQYP